MQEKFQKIKNIAEKIMEQAKDSTHDIDHVMRVYSLALVIAKDEADVDLDILQSAVLLHDIGAAAEASDPSGATDHAVVGAEMARPILLDLGFSEDNIKHIQTCILSHRFRTENKPETIEAKIVHDADKLDSSGAIGITRTFSWIGKHQAKIYKVADIEEYIKENQGGKTNGRIQDKSKHSAQINWELKDKFLLDRLYTATAKKIGEERLKYYKDFLNRLEKEIKGEL